MSAQFRNLVFEGGGVKGIAYAGALAVLEQEGVLPGIKRVAGTSAGAITATLVALGLEADEVARVVASTSFRSFMDDDWGKVRDAKRVWDTYGLYKGDQFSAWIRDLLETHGTSRDLTFGRLKELVDGDPGGRRRHLYVIGSNLSTQLPEIYSAETTPEMPIWQAARISMSIPLFFSSVRTPATRHVYVDGGVSWNYPIDLFDDRRFVEDPAAAVPVQYPTVPATWGRGYVYNKETLGFRISTRDEIAVRKGLADKEPLSIESFPEYLKSMIGFMTELMNKAHIHENDWHRTVFLDANGVRATDFDLPAETIRQLVESGRDGATAYFRWFRNTAAQPIPLNRI